MCHPQVCEHCVTQPTTQHRAALTVFPINLQTIIITRMLSSGGGEAGIYGPGTPHPEINK